MNIRAEAARVIENVIEKKRSLTDSLLTASKKISHPRDHAFLQAVCYGVCRDFFMLDTILAELLEKPVKSADLHALLLVGLYQLNKMRVPVYAAITETVKAAVTLNKAWAKGLVNAILRAYQRRQTPFVFDESAQYNHPAWIIDKLKHTYPAQFEQILTANNQHPPFALRINQQRFTRAAYLLELSKAGIRAECIPGTLSGIVLDQPIDVQHLPDFFSGAVSVQDGAAQLAAELLDLSPGQRVVDACAAPGGKTAHILELEPSVHCFAIDSDASRLQRVKENMQRLHLSATCLTADVGAIETWWDGIEVDRVLLDAPCSASGVIRRHPDIKLLRRESDIPLLVETQLRLLKAVWRTIKPGGKLLYATCSIFREENDDVIQTFLREYPDATQEMSQQILPGTQGMDGFYFARLRK